MAFRIILVLHLMFLAAPVQSGGLLNLEVDKLALLGGSFAVNESACQAEIGAAYFTYKSSLFCVEHPTLYFRWSREYVSISPLIILMGVGSSKLGITDSSKTILKLTKKLLLYVSYVGMGLNSAYFPKYDFPIRPIAKLENDVCFGKTNIRVASNVLLGISFNALSADMRFYYKYMVLPLFEVASKNQVCFSLRLLVGPFAGV